MPKSFAKAQDKPYFDIVDPKVDFPALEKKILADWQKNGIVKKYLLKNTASKKTFSFLDGPITANNPMGVHHAWGRTYKDVWQKYHNMLGYRERFQNGFDCQGLWVEVEVEKDLGFKSKKDIETYGVAKFVNKCKERVQKYSAIQTQQSKRLGYFMDWANSYYTMSDANNYAIWHFLKVCWERSWLYKGHESIPWCPRCETAISQHEILTEDYREVTHEAIYLKLPIAGGDKEYLLVWTTTPWTLPANIAVAVDGELEYALVTDDGNKYWILKELVEKVFGEKTVKIEKVVFGQKLVGLKYTTPFDALDAVKKVSEHPRFHSVVATDKLIMPITKEEGTGLVHTAVSAGEEDFKLGKKLDLPMIPVISDNADYLEDLGEFTGKNAKVNPRVILDYLETQDSQGSSWVFKIEKYKHRYPVCWRCKTELVWKVADEWYIAMDKVDPTDEQGRTLREQMMDVARQIRWLPAFGLERELDWLKNMHDWLISKKNRYWGLALPIYECPKCGNFEVIGDKTELKGRAVEGWNKFEGNTPHRPWIDAVKISCSKCGEKVLRVEDVGNPWLDAGIVPFSTLPEEWFPADFITESFPGQFKNWFYSMIAMSTVLKKTNPFKTVLGFATMLDTQGRPFHKSLGNAIEFVEAADKFGADVIRWFCVTSNPNENTFFGETVANDIRRRFHLKIWNIYNYFVTYANLDGWNSKSQNPVVPAHLAAKRAGRSILKNQKLTILDSWILLRLNQTIDLIKKSLSDYDAYTASVSIEGLVDDFSNWYIRRSRNRTGPSSDAKSDKLVFYKTTFFVLTNLTKILAPFNPYISDFIYKNLTKEDSVHLSDWPEGRELSDEDTKILRKMELVRKVVEIGHAERKNEKIPVRQPLQLIKVSASSDWLSKDFEDLIKDELNVKEVEFVKGGELSVKLDTTITPELEEEAKARELIRNIQAKRKEMNISLTQKITVTNSWIPKNKEATKKIMRQTLTQSLTKGEFEIHALK